MTATPEGFLIAHNVPIARTGWYEYLGEEIGAADRAGEVVRVYRSPEIVFSPAAVASFEGKVVTDEHPAEVVTSSNATVYTKGTVQNVRPGSGDSSDLLIADLVLYDQRLIEEVQAGKREVSCGYDCVYEDMGDGTYQQKQICGNHVAVVKSGRAGDRVAIKDHESKGARKMPTKINLPKKKMGRVTDFLAAVGLKHFATDADPEEIVDAVDSLAEERKADDAEVVQAAAKDVDPAVAALGEKLDQLAAVVAQLAAQKQEVKPEDAIDNLIAELEGGPKPADDDEEESHTIPVEQMDEEGPVSDPADRPKSALTGDNAYKLAALKAIKPVIAAISDPAERKRAADAAIAAVKKTAPSKKPSTYAAIDNGRQKPKPANDSAAEKKDPSLLGKEIAAKYNPHYKNRA
ncbi:DUF2213 domain-containing protein [Paenibacillus sp. GCM10012303]